jgi:hypothetical protein
MPTIPTQQFLKDKKRFDSWRSRRPKRSAIPDRLWRLAASHVNEYGLNKVSREFGVNYSKLKEKILELKSNTLPSSVVKPAFVELALPKQQPSPVCHSSRLRFVFERTDGNRLSLEGDQLDPLFFEKVIQSFYSR